MKSKEEKLSEALNEYFGKDLGDVVYASAESISFDPTKLSAPESNILITTVPHKPTFKEKRKELVDQLDKDLKEIDDGFGAQVISSDGEILIHVGHAKIAELYWDWAINEFHMHVFPIGISVITVVKIMDAVSVFTQELERLKEQYEDETI